MKKQGFKGVKTEFAPVLLKWHREENTRQMPWKGEKDPYKIWLSEIILQQTRVEQGTDYYHKFVDNFPNIGLLAAAPDAKVFKLWEGLGYYSRCRNLLFTARHIVSERKGIFPSEHADIKSLKGIGPYTAAAIASFAFNQPHAVVDGNVYRVLARIFGIDTPIDSTAGKRYFKELADELLDKNEPAAYNQAIMDFGAVVCKPVSPLCHTCIFQKTCSAFLSGRVNELPVKEKKTSVRKRWFYYFVIQSENKTVIQQRTGKDIWSQLYEFPLVETSGETDIKEIIKEAIRTGILPARYELKSISPLIRQTLSHQLIAGRFVLIQHSGTPDKNLHWVAPGEMKEYAFPKIINEYLATEYSAGMRSQELF